MASEKCINESSESSDLMSEFLDTTIHPYNQGTSEYLDVHKHYEVDPKGTTTELASPDMFKDDEEDYNIQTIIEVSIGTNTEDHGVKEDRDDVNMDTINKCYMLGLIIGIALRMMSIERRQDCMHQIVHCFEKGELQF